MDLLKSIAYPKEVYALLKYKIGKALPASLHADAVRISINHAKTHKSARI